MVFPRRSGITRRSASLAHAPKMRRRHLAGLSPIAEVIPRCSLIVAVVRFSRINFISSSPQASSSIPPLLLLRETEVSIRDRLGAGRVRKFSLETYATVEKRRRRCDWMTNSGKMAARGSTTNAITSVSRRAFVSIDSRRDVSSAR